MRKFVWAGVLSLLLAGWLPEAGFSASFDGSAPKSLLTTTIQVAQVTPRAQASTYVGTQVCQACHVKSHASFSETKMGRIFLKNASTEQEARGCEACHGPGSAHVAAPKKDKGAGIPVTFNKGAEPIEQQNAMCLSCHAKGNRTYWKGSQHEGRGVACTSCHSVMKKGTIFVKNTEMETCFQCHTQRRAQLQRSSHMPLREGKITCSDCHNPHGTATEKLIKQNSVNENCYACHAEKRGPLLWEHAPVRENCSNCHEPHGSNHEKLLKVKMPRLCQRCHTEGRHPGTPRDRNSRFVFNSSCLNCHAMIHGSNHPAGVRFQR